MPDITYKTVNGYRPLKLDLYLPTRSDKAVPLVIWIHGGGFEMGNPRADWTYGDWRNVLAELSSRGYAVAAITYRLSAEAQFPAQLEDSLDALRFVRANAALWNIRPDQAIAWGLSAGAGSAALMGTHCTGATGDTGCVQGVIDWFGPTDFTTMEPSPAISRFLGCAADGCTQAQKISASAVNQVTRSTAPFVIMQGEADPLVKASQSQELSDALEAQHVRHELILYPRLSHGFSGGTPTQLREILDTTFKRIDAMSGH